MQYDTTRQSLAHLQIHGAHQRQHPCSEYMFLDDTACNLASLNLMKYVSSNGDFDVEAFTKAVESTITAQKSSSTTPVIPRTKLPRTRTSSARLGLGYANLGALLMSWPCPMTPDEGRDVAAAVTALMCGEAYAQSAASPNAWPFPGYPVNREPHARRHSECPPRHARSARSRPVRSLLGAAKRLGYALELAKARLQEFPGPRSRSHRHHRLHDGFATPPASSLTCPHQIQEARRRRRHQIVNNTVPAAVMKLGYTPEQPAKSSATLMPRQN